MQKNQGELSPEMILEISRSFMQSRILLSAIELDIFTRIGDGKKTSKQIAQEIDADERATDRLLNALCALSILTKEKADFINTPSSHKFLNRTSEMFQGNLFHTAHLWHTWSTLTDSVKKGHAVKQRDTAQQDPQWLEAFIGAMHHRGKKQAPQLASLLNLEKTTNVLDVGGGSGVFAMAIIQQKPDASAVVFDLPDVIPITERYIQQENLSHKIKTQKGNYLTANFGYGFDLIFLSAIIHINSYEENEDLIKRCSDALNTGGQLVVSDFIMDDQRLHPKSGAIFALNMLVGTEKGDTYTQSEVIQWMEKAKIMFEKRIDTAFESSLLIGWKK